MNFNRQTKKQPQPTVPSNQITLNHMEQYKGPIPPPSVLSGFKDIDSSFPERIMRMAEKNNDATIEISTQTAKSNIKMRKAGQILAFVIVLIGFTFAGFSAFVLQSIPLAITSIVASVMPLGITAVKGFLNHN